MTSPQYFENGPLATAAIATSATVAATTVNTALDTDGRIAIACSSAFDINFGPAGVAAPADTQVFPAGVYVFRIRNPAKRYFSLMPHSNGFFRWWHESDV